MRLGFLHPHLKTFLSFYTALLSSCSSERTAHPPLQSQILCSYYTNDLIFLPLFGSFSSPHRVLQLPLSKELIFHYYLMFVEHLQCGRTTVSSSQQLFYLILTINFDVLGSISPVLQIKKLRPVLGNLLKVTQLSISVNNSNFSNKCS